MTTVLVPYKPLRNPIIVRDLLLLPTVVRALPGAIIDYVSEDLSGLFIAP